MRKRWKRVLPAVLLSLALTAGAAGTALGAGDESRFVGGTTVNGVSVADLTVEDAKNQIESYYQENYVLKIEDAEGKTEELRGLDIGYKMEVTGDLSALLQQQNDGGRKSGPGEGNSFQAESQSSFDEALLSQKLAELSFVTEASPTTDARISAYEEGKEFTIIPEVQGNELDMEKFTENVKSALKEQRTILKLADTDSYKKIQVTKEDSGLKALLDGMNAYKDVTITYNFGDQTEELSGEEITQWITGSSGMEIQIDRTKAAAYVKKLADAYDTYGKPHGFHTTAGKDIQIEGEYGWQINQEEETTALLALIKTGESHGREPIYTRTAASRSGYDFGNTYVEVDMANQHLYYYENGTCIVDCPVVTGNVSKNYTTPPGLFTLYYKERDRVLRGAKQADGTYEYESPVSYWMPFNGGIGLHDANWRGSFGGTIYKTNGSHGCINMPPAKAKIVFEHIYKGIPIICHNNE